MAAASPSGKATAIAVRLVVSVATKSGAMPNLPIVGCHSDPVRNSKTPTSRKNADDSVASTTMMPTVVRIDTAAQKNRNPWMARSVGLNRRRNDSVPARSSG